jgi:hypothetical protein
MDVKNELFKLAAEMVMRQNMPSKCYDDWDWPKGMQITSWRKVFDAADKADEQAKDWAVRLRRIIDVLTEATSQTAVEADADFECPRCKSHNWKYGCGDCGFF